MKQIKQTLFVVAVLCLAFSAQADSWANFNSSMSNASFVQGQGSATNYGGFTANGGSSDQLGGVSVVSANALMGGAVQSCNCGEGSVQEGLDISTFAQNAQGATSANATVNSMVQTFGSGPVTTSGYIFGQAGSFATNGLIPSPK